MPMPIHLKSEWAVLLDLARNSHSNTDVRNCWHSYLLWPFFKMMPQDSRQADPRKRLKRFFETLYASLTKGARAVLQMYPENADQVRDFGNWILNTASPCEKLVCSKQKNPNYCCKQNNPNCMQWSKATRIEESTIASYTWTHKASFTFFIIHKT